MEKLIEKAQQIKCLITDLDGVLTDGKMILSDLGHQYKAFHVQDGMGIKLLMAAGIEVAVITTSASPVIDHRMQQLGIRLYRTGQVNKQKAYQEIKQSLGLKDYQLAYIGDDLPDLPLLKQVGLGIAVANAVRQVKEAADWQTELEGGNGAVRELCDFILNAQGKFDLALSEYLKC